MQGEGRTHTPPAAGGSAECQVEGHRCTHPHREAVTALSLQRKQNHGAGKSPTDQPSEGLHTATDQTRRTAGGDSTHPLRDVPCAGVVTALGDLRALLQREAHRSRSNLQGSTNRALRRPCQLCDEDLRNNLAFALACLSSQRH